jgi:glutathione synthase/RimK-type ligase-like ATP-grasp enzyme
MTKRLLIYVTEETESFAEAIAHVWENDLRGSFQILQPKAIGEQGIDNDHDLIHLRFGVPSTSSTYELLEQHVHSHGCLCINKPEVMTLTVNKLKATSIASDIMVVPKSMKWNREEANMEAAMRALHFPVVMKPLCSSGGYNIHFYKDHSEFRGYCQEEMTDGQWKAGKNWMLQEAVDFDKIVRVVYMDGKLLDAVYDDATDKYTIRLRLGSHAKMWPEGERRELAETSAKLVKKFGMDMAVIDYFVMRDGEFVFNEINSASNLRWLRKRSGVAHATLIANYLDKRFRESRR